MLARLRGQTDVLMAVGVIGLIGMMIIPLPTWVLDLLLVSNIAVSLSVLLIAMYLARPLEFSVLPSLLLVTTLFRLGLNISSTRLVLLHADAGRVIEAFGNFVVGGDLLVGCVVFIIIVVIQFVVITSGSGRVAEVAARFTLDEMPGKQMSIDADLNAGAITEAEARHRRREIEREADFYGAMDGASKFIRGDAIAGIVIVGVNILGGIAIGVGRMGMPLMEALQRYALLTVGDGLVSQIPALLISTATGIVVTRAASEHDLGRDVASQLTAHPRALTIAGSMLLALGLVPGLPKFSFLFLGALVVGAGQWLGRARAPLASAPGETGVTAPTVEATDDRLPLGVDRLALDIGYSLIALLEHPGGPGLLDRVTALRQQLSRELGIPIPPVRVRDDISLPPNEYVIRLRGSERARGQVRPGMLMAIPNRPDAPPLPGEETREPVFDLPARWIAREQQLQAETRGHAVVEPAAVIATHLSETIRRHAAEVLSRQDVADLIDQVREREPAVVTELIPELATVGVVHQVLRELLEEGLSIRDLPSLLEALADGLRLSGQVQSAIEYVRMTQAEAICERLCGQGRLLRAITISPELERLVEDCLVQTPDGAVCALPPIVTTAVVRELGSLSQRLAADGRETVVLSSPRVRPLVRSAIARHFPRVWVLSYAELAPQVQVETVAQLGLPEGAI
ncbi:MAG: flagellar biosynthesis protein FlhA [Armatimonadetes bacterium]|nr:flagellar biosynthesis protein FlhA [Armatimonadota bacterium]